MHTQRVAGIAIASLAAVVGSCATSTIPPPPRVAGNLTPPAGQTLSAATNARGVQIYECVAGKTDPARMEWTLKAPQAELTEGSGKVLGKHYGGPTWEGTDGSKVVGELKARDDGPDPNAIPWLLLSAKSSSGSGMFGRTQWIQRVNTVGGKAPASCQKAGEELRVPYTAVYYFYGPGK
jgi:hypothetical protein